MMMDACQNDGGEQQNGALYCVLYAWRPEAQLSIPIPLPTYMHLH